MTVSYIAIVLVGVAAVLYLAIRIDACIGRYEELRRVAQAEREDAE